MKSLVALLACLAIATAIDDGQWHPALDGSYLGQWNPWMDGSYNWGHPFIHRLKRDLITPAGVVLHDDGQWKPAFDGSWLGSGKLVWGKGIVGSVPHAIIGHHLKKRDLITPAGIVLHDDGQWKPALDGSWLGSGKLAWGKGIIAAPHAIIAHRFKRDLYTNPWIYSNSYLNALGLPMDAPHVAAVKHAHLIQQASEGARNMMGGGIPLALPADTPEVAAGKISHAIAHSHQKAINAGIYGSLII